MPSDPDTRVFLTSGGHVDVKGEPWQVAYQLWGRRDSDLRPTDRDGHHPEPDAEQSGTAGLVGLSGETEPINLRPDEVHGVAAIPA